MMLTLVAFLIQSPNAGGQCNYTVEASANPQVNTFSITSILTTAAVKLLLSCASTQCPSGGGNKARGVLSDRTLEHREAVRAARSSPDFSDVLGRSVLPPLQFA